MAMAVEFGFRNFDFLSITHSILDKPSSQRTRTSLHLLLSTLCSNYIRTMSDKKRIREINSLFDQLDKKLSHSHQKVARSRLEEKIEKGYVVNEAEAYLRQAMDDLNNDFFNTDTE